MDVVYFNELNMMNTFNLFYIWLDQNINFVILLYFLLTITRYKYIKNKVNINFFWIIKLTYYFTVKIKII